MRGRVLVIGGGLAGITAALDCARAGVDVTLVEVRRRLGGAAYSVQRGGLEMDNGQHVFLRCCGAYRELLEQLGSTPLVSLQERLEIPVLKPGAPATVIRRGSLPAPLHLAPALLRYPHLSPRERVGAARAALALRRVGPPAGPVPGLRSRVGRSGLFARRSGRAGDPDSRTLGEWLERRGQGARAQAALWDLIALPTLNLPAAQASLALGAFVFREGVLSDAGAGDIGFHEATLGATIGEPAQRELERAGVRVQLGWRAEALRPSAGGFELQGRSGAETEQSERDGLSGEAAVVALPHTRAAGLLEPLLGERASRWRGLGSSPIVNLHLLYDREVMSERFAAGVETPVQYLFDRSAAGGAPTGSQYLAVSLSGAEREMTMSVDALRERFVPAIAELLPRTRGAALESFLVTREHAATFRAAPGCAALRPGPVSGIDGLALAGAWTATGWPATLEGAVLSGHAASAHALAALGTEQQRAAPAAAAPAVAAPAAAAPTRPPPAGDAAPSDSEPSPTPAGGGR